MTNNIKSKNKVMLKSKPCKGYLSIKIPKPPKTVAPKCIVLINTYRLTQKEDATPTSTPTNHFKKP